MNVGRSVRVIMDAHTRPVHAICQNQGSSYASHSPEAYDLFLTAAVTDGIKMWDLRTNRCVRRYEGHANRSHPTGIAISPCSRYIATGSEDRSVYLFDVRGSSFCHRLTGHTEVVADVAFHPAYSEIMQPKHSSCKPNARKQNYHDFRLGTINTRTCRCESKLAECVQQFKILSHDITCMQEVRQKGEGEICFSDPILEGWKIIYNGLKTARAGIAIALAPHVRLLDVNHVVEGRMTMIRVTVHGVKLSIINCYCPTEQYAESTKQSFYQSLQKLVHKCKNEHPSFKVIVAGDFNATIGNDCEVNKWHSVGRFNDNNQTSFNGLRLIETAESKGLYLLNTMFATKSDEHRWSFASNLGYKRRLDYIMAEWFVKRATKNCRVYPKQSEIFESDHRIVVMHASFPTKSKIKKIFSKKRGPSSTQDLRCLRDDPTIQASYSAKLDQLTENGPELDQIDKVEELIVNAIEQASLQTIPTRTHHEDKKPWINEEYQKLLLQHNREKDPSKCRMLAKDIKKLRTTLKNAYFKSKADSINLASEQRKTEEEFRLMKQYTSLEKSSHPLVSTQKLEEHFEKHFDARVYEPQPELEHPENYPHILPPEDMPVIDTSIPNRSEIEAGVKKLKNGKCRGTDNVYAEHLKYTTSEGLMKYLLVLITQIWTCLQVPSRWLISSITCLYKRGLRSDAANYRGLSIIATLSKIVSGIIVERAREAYEYILLSTQYGFRSNRSTTDAIFILRQILESSRKTKTPLFIAFVDLKAAYDWIPREALLTCLEIRLKCPQIVAILRALYTGTKACIKGTGRFFDTLVGCRQGALESPSIFNIYMDFVVRIAQHEISKLYPDVGFKFSYCIPNEVSTREMRKKARASGNNCITEILYADDQAILAGSIEELQNILQLYDETYSRFGLQISYAKTETMAFNVSEEIKCKPSIISLGGTNIKNVRTFKYLGYNISNGDESSHFLYTRISAAFMKWNELKHILVDHRILLKTRIKFLVACVRSRLLYSTQAWQLSSDDIHKIEVVWHGFLRKMIKGGYKRKNAPKEKNTTSEDFDWSYKLSNADLRKLTETQDIKFGCYEQQLKYIAHVCRMDNDQLQKQLLFNHNYKWTKWENLLGIDIKQIRRMMMDKSNLKQLLQLLQ